MDATILRSLAETLIELKRSNTTLKSTLIINLDLFINTSVITLNEDRDLVYHNENIVERTKL